MTGTSALETLLKRDRAVTIAGLAVLCMLAWLYILTGAGLGMDMRAMISASAFPFQGTMAMAPMMMDWDRVHWALMLAMWWVMMIAMMTPGAAPTVLLYARVHRHAADGADQSGKLAPTGAFVAGYLLVWLGFSVLATALCYALDRAGLLSPMQMSSQSAWISGGLLIVAGIYQFTPVKTACLSHCRAPGAFLARHWRPGAFGALRLGILHGGFCVACCWLLMALLFVGGAMNLLWIAGLSCLVLIERLLPPGRWLGRVAGIALILWGAAMIAFHASA